MMLTIFVLLPIGNSIWRSSQEHCRIMGPSGSAGKSRSVDQTPVLGFRNLQFCCQKSGCARRFPTFPCTSGNGNNNLLPQSENAIIPFGKRSLKRKNRLSAVSTDQAGRTVAGPHHSRNIKEKPNLSQSLTGKPQRIKAEQQCVSKVTCEQKNTRHFVFSQLRCKF